jgi:DNA repair protein RecN (Recombination protein N)
LRPNPGEGLKPLVKIASAGENIAPDAGAQNVLARADEVAHTWWLTRSIRYWGRVGRRDRRKLWQLGAAIRCCASPIFRNWLAFGDQHFRVPKTRQMAAPPHAWNH